MPRSVSFWLVGTAFIGLFAAAGAPTPLYGVLQREWHLSAGIVSIAFAVYSAGMLAAILPLGRLADHVGRRPVIIASLSVAATSMVLVAVAQDIRLVIAARALQGISTGIAVGPFASILTELAPASRPSLGPMIAGFAGQGGLAAGALLAGAVLRLPLEWSAVMFYGFTAFFIAAIVVVFFTEETGSLRAGAIASLTPRISVPAPARSEFVAAAITGIAVWMFGALYMAMISVVLTGVFADSSSLSSGVYVTLLAGGGSLAGLAVGRVAARPVTLAGSAFVLAGACLVVVSIAMVSLPMLVIATVIGGIGFGTAYSGSMRLLASVTQGENRSRVYSALYATCFMSFGFPITIAGWWSDEVGPATAFSVYSTITAVIALLAVAAQWQRLRSSRVRR